MKEGIHLTVLSCMIRPEVEANPSLLRFKDFNPVYSLEDYGEDHKRPDPTGLIGIMKQLVVEPSKTIYVDDTHNGILMGKNAGVISVGVRTGAQDDRYLEEVNPDHLIASFSNLPEVVVNYNRPE